MADTWKLTRGEAVTVSCDTCSESANFISPQYVSLNGWQYQEGYLTLCPICRSLYGKGQEE